MKLLVMLLLAFTLPQRYGQTVSLPSPQLTLHNYYAALNRGDLSRAYSMWSDNGRASRQIFSAFAAGFAQTRSTSVTTGRPRNFEGAAGTFYVDVPVKVQSLQKDNSARFYVGTYTLCREDPQTDGNGGDMNWHLFSSNIRELRNVLGR